MKKIHSKFTIFFLSIFFFTFLSAITQNLPPKPNKLVNDYVGILSSSEIYSLEQKLIDFDNSTSTQIIIVIIDDLQGYDPSDFAQRIGEKWGAGRKGYDNGVVILLKPTGGQGQKKVEISTGYGLEGVIPDLTARRIVDNEMIPYFKQGDYYSGLDKATTTLMKLAAGEFTAAEYNKAAKGSNFGFLLPIINMVIMFFVFRIGNARSYSVGKGIPFWTAFWLMSSTSYRGHGHYGHFSSGSGSFGGGSSFGGFGGGSFGGGGAGGSW